MKTLIIIKDRVQFRERLSLDSALFQTVCDLVEALDGRHPLAHHITRQSCVVCAPSSDAGGHELRAQRDIDRIQALETSNASLSRRLEESDDTVNELSDALIEARKVVVPPAAPAVQQNLDHGDE